MVRIIHGFPTTKIIPWKYTKRRFFKIKTRLWRRRAVFWEIMLCSQLKANQRFGGTCRLYLQGRRIIHARKQHEALLATCFMLISWLAYYSTLKMQVTCFSEMLADFQWTT
jgi:hypothetical protein